MSNRHWTRACKRGSLWAMGVALCARALSASAATASITVNVDDRHWESVGQHTAATCTTPCADYSTAMVPHLEITLPSLPANQTDYYLDLSATPVTAVAANDGLHAYSAANVERVVVTTDSQGIPTQFIVVLQAWSTDTNPQRSGDRYAEFIVANHGGYPGMQARTNLICATSGFGAGGMPDFCVSGAAEDGTQSFAIIHAIPEMRIVAAPDAKPQSAPALSPWALFAMSLTLFGAAVHSFVQVGPRAGRVRTT